MRVSLGPRDHLRGARRQCLPLLSICQHHALPAAAWRGPFRDVSTSLALVKRAARHRRHFIKHKLSERPYVSGIWGRAASFRTKGDCWWVSAGWPVAPQPEDIPGPRQSQPHGVANWQVRGGACAVGGGCSDCWSPAEGSWGAPQCTYQPGLRAAGRTALLHRAPRTRQEAQVNCTWSSRCGRWAGGGAQEAPAGAWCRSCCHQPGTGAQEMPRMSGEGAPRGQVLARMPMQDVSSMPHVHG